MKKSIKISFLFLMTILLFGATDVPSFFDQKLKLENKVKGKVEEVLSKVTTSDSYNVNVNISALVPTVPVWEDPKPEDNDEDFGGGRKSRKGSEGGQDKSTKKDDVNIAQKKEKNKEGDEKVDISLKNKVTFDDVDLPEREDEFVLLNKFGLEAPLVEDYQDLTPDGKILLKMGGGVNDVQEKEEREDRIREEDREDRYEQMRMIAKMIKLGTKKSSEVEKMWKFNEAVDIYKNLEAVDITVQLSKGLENRIKQAAEKYVKEISFNLGEITPKIKFEYVNLGRDFISTEESKKDLMDYLGLIAQFATLIGIVLGVILFGFVGNSLIKKYFQLNTGTQNQSTMSMDGGLSQENEDGDDAGGGGGVGGVGADGGLDLIVNGVERFETFYQNNPVDSILIIKKWIRERTKSQVYALKALVQQLDNESLVPMMNQLTEEERASWKDVLDSGLNPEELAKANTYIGNQIIQNLMVPEFIKDPEIYAKITKLKASEFKDFLKKDLVAACLLLPILGTEFINQVLNSIDDSLRERVLSISMGIGPSSYVGGEEKIKALLTNVESGARLKPFLKSLEKLLPQAAKNLEEGLYKHYINEAEETDVERVLREFYPGFLVKKLPENFLKNCLNKYPLAKKVKLLYSLSDEEQLYFVELFAVRGSKADDLLNLEFENIENDERLQKEIVAEADNLWHEFVVYVRSMISKDKSIKGPVMEILEEWRSQNQKNSKGNLKAVA